MHARKPARPPAHPAKAGTIRSGTRHAGRGGPQSSAHLPVSTMYRCWGTRTGRAYSLAGRCTAARRRHLGAHRCRGPGDLLPRPHRSHTLAQQWGKGSASGAAGGIAEGRTAVHRAGKAQRVTGMGSAAHSSRGRQRHSCSSDRRALFQEASKQAGRACSAPARRSTYPCRRQAVQSGSATPWQVLPGGCSGGEFCSPA